MWPISMVLRSFSGAAAAAHRSPAVDLADVGELRLEIAPGRDVAQMVIVLVGARDHVAARFEREVGDDRACS